MEAWFRDYDEMRERSFYDAVRAVPESQRQPVDLNNLERLESAFQRMGTNAVPLLAARINRNFGYSKMDVWRIKIRWRLPQLLKGLLPLPTSRGTEAWTAAQLLGGQIKPPGELLLPLIVPALESTNADQRGTAFSALYGISSGYELCRPYLEKGLKDPNSQVQRLAANTVGGFRAHGSWAVSNLLELVTSPDFRTYEYAINALSNLGTNARPAVPRLKEMLATEQDEKRRAGIVNTISFVTGPAPLAPSEK